MFRRTINAAGSSDCFQLPEKHKINLTPGEDKKPWLTSCLLQPNHVNIYKAILYQAVEDHQESECFVKAGSQYQSFRADSIGILHW
jgi:hypothetical protein